MATTTRSYPAATILLHWDTLLLLAAVNTAAELRVAVNRLAKAALAAAFAKRFDGEANPNAELIRRLSLAGVSVCFGGNPWLPTGSRATS